MATIFHEQVDELSDSDASPKGDLEYPAILSLFCQRSTSMLFLLAHHGVLSEVTHHPVRLL